MGYYDAGPKTDKPPVVLCHGWPELAFSWRHQIKALSEAGIRVIAPDQRGYGATERPEPVEDYDMEHLTGDLVGLLDHLRDRQGDLRRPRLGRLCRLADAAAPSRARRRRGRRQHAALGPRARRCPIELFRQRYRRHRCTSSSSRNPAREPDKIFGSRVEQTFDAFMRKPAPRAKDAARSSRAIAGVGASATAQSGLSADDRQSTTPGTDPRTPILSPEEKKVFVDTFTKTGFTGGINWYRNFTRNWQRAEGLDHHMRVPSLMIMAENDAVLPPSAADGMEQLVPDLEKYLVTRQRPLDAAGKAGRGQRQTDRMA